jgi:hypothetical protein
MNYVKNNWLLKDDFYKGECALPNPELQKPLWAWFVLIGGGLFLLNALPGMIFTLLMPFIKRGGLSFISFFYIIFGLSILLIIVWGMKRVFLL